MRLVIALLALLVAALTTYLLLGRLPYVGPQTEVGIIDGPDINVPYHDKYGLLGYACARDYYSQGRIVERRIESLHFVRLVLSCVLVSLVWFVAWVVCSKIWWAPGRAATSSQDDQSTEPQQNSPTQ